MSLGCPPLVASVEGKQEGEAGAGLLVGTIPLSGSTSILDCWCLQSSSIQGAGSRESWGTEGMCWSTYHISQEQELQERKQRSAWCLDMMIHHYK